MASTVFPAASAASKTRFVTSLISGTSYTVPAGVTYVNVRLIGGAGGLGSGYESASGSIVSSSLSTTPGDSIAYAIGAGVANNTSGAGGTTTFTGATSAPGGGVGAGGNHGHAGPLYEGANNGGGEGSSGTGSGGQGKIDIEYWA